MIPSPWQEMASLSPARTALSDEEMANEILSCDGNLSMYYRPQPSNPAVHRLAAPHKSKPRPSLHLAASLFSSHYAGCSTGLQPGLGDGSMTNGCSSGAGGNGPSAAAAGAGRQPALLSSNRGSESEPLLRAVASSHGHLPTPEASELLVRVSGQALEMPVCVSGPLGSEACMPSCRASKSSIPAPPPPAPPTDGLAESGSAPTSSGVFVQVQVGAPAPQLQGGTPAPQDQAPPSYEESMTCTSFSVYREEMLLSLEQLRKQQVSQSFASTPWWYKASRTSPPPPPSPPPVGSCLGVAALPC